MAVLVQILERLQLTLNKMKTKIVNAHKEQFDFLGFTIGMKESSKTGNVYPHIQPSRKALPAIKDRVTAITQRKMTAKPLGKIVTEVNATVRGWVGYFQFKNCSRVLVQLKRHVEERLQTHLRKRHKIKDRGTAMQNLAAVLSMANTAYTRCQQQRVGRKRMLCSEEHRKAVWGKTPSTV